MLAANRDFEDLTMILRVGVHNGTCVTSSDGDGSSGRSRRSGGSRGGSHKWTTIDLREVQKTFLGFWHHPFFLAFRFFGSPFFFLIEIH